MDLLTTDRFATDPVLGILAVTRIKGTGGADQLDGTDNADRISGLGGGDLIYGEFGDDTLLGGGGADTLRGGLGGDRIDGGQGCDLAVFEFRADEGSDVDVSGFKPGHIFTIQDELGIDTLVNVEQLQIEVGIADDNVVGSKAGDIIISRGGRDVIDAGGGNDSIEADLTYVGSAATVFGGAGDDAFLVHASHPSLTAHFNGGGGVDVLEFNTRPFTAAVTVALAGDHLDASSSDGGLQITATHIELLDVRAGAGADVLIGGSGDDSLDGGESADSLVGGAGDDLLCGGDHGNGASDTLDGGDGRDLYEVLNFGAALQDYSSFDASGGDVIVTDTAGGQDHLSSIEGVALIAFNQTGGTCTLIGSSGHDWLVGGLEVDFLQGGDGDDRLTGRAGADILVGGAGRDVFQYELLTDSAAASQDLIVDLQRNDRIDLSLIDADETNGAADDTFVLVSHLTGLAGEASLSFASEADQTLLELDVDGDGEADMVITIQGDHTDFTNFVL